jgi:hypothetical protein
MLISDSNAPQELGHASQLSCHDRGGAIRFKGVAALLPGWAGMNRGPNACGIARSHATQCPDRVRV